MENRLRKVFTQSTACCPENLSGNIWHVIETRKERKDRIRFWSFAAVGMVSFLFAIVTFRTMGTSFSQSGFFEYLSVAFSGGGVLASSWKELLLSLMNSLPFTSIILFLVPVFALLWSLSRAINFTKKSPLVLSA